ncbi:MAG TPA: CHASE2 domain-containing protein [Planktothrix sp.]
MATLLLAESPMLESMELNMLEWHYKISNWFSTSWPNSVVSKDIALVDYDDDSQYDLSFVRFSDKDSQDVLAQAINKIEAGNPAIVVLDLDLRGAAAPELINCLQRYQNVVIGLFGSLDGPAELPSKFLKYASYGYDELPRESSGLVCRMPINYRDSDGTLENPLDPEGLAPMPSLTEAVIDLWSKLKGVGPNSRYLYSHSDQPLYISFRNIQFPTVSFRNLLEHEFDPSPFRDRIVMVGTTFTQRRSEAPRHRTPLQESQPDLNVHANAIETVLDNQMIYSCPPDITHHLLLLFGAAFGAVASILTMSRRVTAFLVSGMVLFCLSQLAFQLFRLNIPVASPIAVLFLGACLGTFIYLDTDLRQRNRELAEARESMQVRAEEERQRIAEDLHDETLPALSSVARMADRLASELSDNPVPTQMREKLDHAVVEMRRVINDLHPSVLETMGFKPALENLAVMLTRETGIESNFSDGDGHDDYKLNNFTRLQLYRIVQEALNNVQKHSGAKLVEVSIGQTNGDLIISVADDGKGIDPRLIRRDSHGLLNIRQRAQLIGANVEWAKPEKFHTGTELRLKITIEPEQING